MLYTIYLVGVSFSFTVFFTVYSIDYLSKMRKKQVN